MLSFASFTAAYGVMSCLIEDKADQLGAMWLDTVTAAGTDSDAATAHVSLPRTMWQSVRLFFSGGCLSGVASRQSAI